MYIYIYKPLQYITIILVVEYSIVLHPSAPVRPVAVSSAAAAAAAPRRRPAASCGRRAPTALPGRETMSAKVGLLPGWDGKAMARLWKLIKMNMKTFSWSMMVHISMKTGSIWINDQFWTISRFGDLGESNAGRSCTMACGGTRAIVQVWMTGTLLHCTTYSIFIYSFTLLHALNLTVDVPGQMHPQNSSNLL